MDLCKMHFCKHMNGFFMHSITLPEKVKIHFASLAGKLLELKRPNGKIWYVGLVKNGEKLVLQPGWHDFVSANDVSQNDLLVFKYNSETTFEVLIFDQSGFEKSCKTEEKSTGSLQIITRDELIGPKPVNVASQLPASDLQENEEDENSESDQISETRTPPLTENSGKRKERTSDARQLASERRQKAQKMQQQVQPGNPSFSVLIKPSHILRSVITIPSKFSSEHLPKKSGSFVLHLAGDKEWLVKYIDRSYRQELQMKHFFLDSNVQLGDFCLFELVKEATQTTFNVHISRNY
ncbi:B3 domain-containing protein [Rhynchospora pubera]|uniref:B3 domain-containing protein n=1 Tax=Rhynchospora pubera TaxID=906938 RepID=A0AAV8EWA9_9POAL|nr:B3 domain-containing protein [Rhynchospora pubera]